MRFHGVVLTAGVIALGACAGGGDKNASTSTPDSTAAAAATPAPAEPAPSVIPAPMPRSQAAPVAPVAPAAPAAGNDAEKRLELLKRLYDKGLITSDEYQKKRQEILQGL